PGRPAPPDRRTRTCIVRSSRSGLRRRSSCRGRRCRSRNRSAWPNRAAARTRTFHTPGAGRDWTPARLGHLQDVAADNEFLDFGRAFIDAQRADLTVELLNHLARAHAAAAEHLHGAV